MLCVVTHSLMPGCAGPGLALRLPDDAPGPGPPGARRQDVAPQHHLGRSQAQQDQRHLGVRYVVGDRDKRCSHLSCGDRQTKS